MKGFLTKGRTEIFFTDTSELRPQHRKSIAELKKENQNANLGVEISVLNLNLLELNFFSLAQTGLGTLPEQVTCNISKYSDLRKVQKLFHYSEDN